MIVVDEYSSDVAGGFYVKFSDPSQGFVGAHIHATPQLLAELRRNFRTHRGAPADKIDNAIRLFNDPNLPDPPKIQAFARAYGELVDDIVDLRVRGLKSNTPHDEHQNAKQGKTPDKKWLRGDQDDAYQAFREANR